VISRTLRDPKDRAIAGFGSAITASIAQSDSGLERWQKEALGVGATYKKVMRRDPFFETKIPPHRALRFKVQSEGQIYRSLIKVKDWLIKMPSVADARPAQCLGCAGASRPAGKKLVIHGDGTRERQLRGPMTPDGIPELIGVLARRYECQRCGACMLVVPSEVLAHRQYTACAIGLALAKWSAGATEAAVRQCVSPLKFIGDAAFEKWVTLRRWAAAAVGGLKARLFRGASSRQAPEAFTLRQHAERTAGALVALAPPGFERLQAAFIGGGLHRPPRPLVS
jgi:ferredoxin